MSRLDDLIAARIARADQALAEVLADDPAPTNLTDEHDCQTCEACVHDGHRCCGCYDGACCQEATTAEPQEPIR